MGSLEKGVAMIKLRPRVKYRMTFEERLAEEAKRFREGRPKENRQAACLGTCLSDGLGKLRQHPM